MLDLVIRGGDVVTPQGSQRVDVGVTGEIITVVAAPGTLPTDNARLVIDAMGKIVIPGGVDPHIHCQFEWQLPDGSRLLTDGPDVVGKAALYGGTTTLIDFAPWRKDMGTIQQIIEARDKQFVGNCPCDFSYHIMMLGEIPHTIPDQVAEAIAAGYPSYKVFTTDIFPPPKGIGKVDFGDIWELFKVLSRQGGLGVIHAEDNDIVMHMYEKHFRENKIGMEYMAEVHNTLSEDLSFRRVMRLAESVPGTALYMVHVSAATGVSAIADFRRKGLPIYGETLHQYMCFTAEDYKRPEGAIFHTYPSLKSAEDRKALWDGALSGDISTVATDELCCSYKTKTAGRRIDDVTGGNSGVEPRVGVMYTEMVARRGYSLRQFVDMISTNAAKIMGLYPQKGAIAPGSDADIVLLDPTRRGKLRKEDLHETDYSPWEGHDIFAWPVMTIMRGKVVVENSRYVANNIDGNYLKRKVSDEILNGPAL